MKNDSINFNYIDVTSGVDLINSSRSVNGVKNMFVIVVDNDIKFTQSIAEKLFDNRANVATVGFPIGLVINNKF